MELKRDELDLPPEYVRYRDEGCDFADSCLNCPFAKCIYELPGGQAALDKEVKGEGSEKAIYQ